jgi:hypothetical protein
MWRPVVILRDVDDVIEQVRFAVLTAEVLLLLALSGHDVAWEITDSADNVIVVGQMCLAVLASIYLGRV